MEAAIQKKVIMFWLNVDLIDRLKEMARREHRSLNNFVECILLDVAYNEPNEVTKAAIEEVRSRFSNQELKNTRILNIT